MKSVLVELRFSTGPSGNLVSKSITATPLHLLKYLTSYIISFNNVLNLSQYLTKLMHKICFTVSFISCLYMFRAHVLIIKRSKLHYTSSGIITPIGVMIPEAV